MSEADVSLVITTSEPEPVKLSAKEKLELLLLGMLDAAKERLAAAGKTPMTEAQEREYYATLQVKARKFAAWTPRKKTKKPFDRVMARRKNRIADRARARNRRG